MRLTTTKNNTKKFSTNLPQQSDHKITKKFSTNLPEQSHEINNLNTIDETEEVEEEEEEENNNEGDQNNSSDAVGEQEKQVVSTNVPQLTKSIMNQFKNEEENLSKKIQQQQQQTPINKV